MTPILVPASATPSHDPDQPRAYQLYDLFEAYLPPPIGSRLREMNQSTPLLGLHSRIGTGDITHGQWALYTETCLVGQIVNGGVEQFIENCPGLISDAEKLLAAYGPPALHDAYVKAAAPFLAVIADHAAQQSDATGDALAPFHADFEAAWDVVDESLFGPIEASCYAKARDADPENGFIALEDRLLRWVLAHPEEFRQAG